MTDDRYLTTAEALTYLHTTPRTLYRRLADGGIPAMRIGHQWRFRKSDLDRWLQARGTGLAMHPETQVPASAPSASTSPAAETIKKPRILVIDDEPTVCEMVVNILEMSDCEVESVVDGNSGINHLRAKAYDLIVTDLRMPGADGIAVATEAKRLWPSIKVIIITAYPSQSSAIDAVNIGVDGYVTKPFRPLDLLMATARALSLGVPGSLTHSFTATRS